VAAAGEGNITVQEGFISGQFHRNITPESRYNFINVAVWNSEDMYWKAYGKSVTPMKAKLEQLGVEMVPALYQVAIEY
jgi:heme oxygenase (mycobilin-producing)